jgi:hypothetical protein
MFVPKLFTVAPADSTCFSYSVLSAELPVAFKRSLYPLLMQAVLCYSELGSAIDGKAGPG